MTELTPVHLEIGNGRIVYPNGEELCRMPASCVTGEWIEKANRIVEAVNTYAQHKEVIKDLLEVNKKMWSHIYGNFGDRKELEKESDVAIQKAQELAGEKE